MNPLIADCRLGEQEWIRKGHRVEHESPGKSASRAPRPRPRAREAPSRRRQQLRVWCYYRPNVLARHAKPEPRQRHLRERARLAREHTIKDLQFLEQQAVGPPSPASARWATRPSSVGPVEGRKPLAPHSARGMQIERRVRADGHGDDAARPPPGGGSAAAGDRADVERVLHASKRGALTVVPEAQLMGVPGDRRRPA